MSRTLTIDDIAAIAGAINIDALAEAIALRLGQSGQQALAPDVKAQGEAQARVLARKSLVEIEAHNQALLRNMKRNRKGSRQAA